ncbi:septation protein SepH [Streptomonospora litoralis]|uniref:DUF3071 domain-containing protein n=1 Tax=Streptomonospora litoralis TaxID=2498135 RepID=A0A4P6Q7F2_9ACTN|nr:septation protein SepH [Streptomonospora litoralis]QBI54747.1 hypothetical protein EKD16_14835 [Streptomonospora litoralis]
MHELRLAAVSEDGTYLVLASAGRGTRFMLPVDDRLRAAVRGQFSRLGQYEIEVENPLRPKEIQARIRSGETAEAISELSGIPIERVRWFESPVLQEREYIAQQAQRASVRRQGESAPGPVLGDLVTGRIGGHQLETGDAVWDSWKREDGTWQLKLAFLVAGEERIAHWLYEPRRRSVTPVDEEAVRFLAPDADEPLDLGPGSANVTPFVPRRQGSAPEPPRPEPARPEPARPEPARPDSPLPSAPSAPQPTEEAPAPPDPPERREGPAAGRTRITPGRVAPAARESAAEPTAPQRPEPAPTEQQPPAAREAGEAPAASDEAPDPAAPEPAEAPQPAERPERPAAGRTTVADAEPPAAQRQSADAGRGSDQPEPKERPAARRQEPPVSAAAAGTTGPSGGGNSRRKGRGRRASVPSWDEIMFGSKKSE